jgi:hypothetical protein
VTQAGDWAALRQSVIEAVRGYYFDQPDKAQCTVRLHLVKDEVLAVA